MPAGIPCQPVDRIRNRVREKSERGGSIEPVELQPAARLVLPVVARDGVENSVWGKSGLGHLQIRLWHVGGSIGAGERPVGAYAEAAKLRITAVVQKFPQNDELL